MSEGRSLLLLSCSNHKDPGPPTLGPHSGRSFPQILPRAARNRILYQRDEIRQMLRGGPPRLYNEDMRGGYRDDYAPNRKLANGGDFGGSEAGAYLQAYNRYTGKFFGRLVEMAPHFWEDLPKTTIEIIFVSGLYGLVFWDELIQNYDCHFADYSDDTRRRKVKDFWGEILSQALIEYLRMMQSRSVPITTVYDLLSERLYQDLFAWDKIRGVAVLHRIFRGVAGQDILDPLARTLATNISRFGSGEYTQGWDELADDKETPQFGFELKVDDDRTATREGDPERIRKLLLKEQEWLNELSTPLVDAIVRAELSWRKVEDFPNYEWGGLVVSFANPVEKYLKDRLGLVGKETLGQVIEYIRKTHPKWRRTLLKDLEELNSLFIRGKRREPTPITNRSEVSDFRCLTFKIVRAAMSQTR